MGAIVRLSNDALEVVPGADTSLQVTVRNTGTVVDQFAIDVLGDAAPWATIEPATLSLFPAAEGAVTVRFAPPRSSSVAAGDVPFAIRAASHEDPQGSAVEEGTLTVHPFADSLAELLPRTSRGSRAARHELAIDNRGNSRLNATIEPTDPDQLLSFDVKPPGIVVEPGTAGFSNIRVRPRKGFWRGMPKTRPFKVAVSAPGQTPMMLDGTMVQEALLPGWLIPALLGLLALVILAIILWATVLQPTIKSAATQALADAGFTPIPAGAGGAPNGGGAGPSASPTPAPVATSGGSVLTPPPSPSAGTSTGAGGFPGHPVDGRLSVDGTNPTGVTASKTTLYVTDLVFANPNGRSGTLNLKRGSLTIITLRLENFRDLDYHFVTPVVIPNGQSLVLSATCTSSGTCDPSVFFSGYTNP
jgi:hypothetical protein